MSPIFNTRGKRSALSLTETLLSLAVIAIVATIGVQVVSSVCQNARREKLTNDVRELNNAVAVYLANGGPAGELQDAETVLLRLKQTRSDADRAVFAGAASGQLIDQRLSIRYFTATGDKNSNLRAYWDAEELVFKLTSDPGEGIKEFWYNEDSAALDYGIDENRKASALTYAREKEWVWDYSDRTGAADRGPSQIALASPVTLPTAPPTTVTPPDPENPEDPESSDDSSSGGIALNLGSGSATADDGIALNVLSDDVNADEGELSLGVLGINLTLGGSGGDSSDSESGVSTSSEGSGSGLELNLGEGDTAVDDGVAANVGDGTSSATDGISANVGDGTSTATNGIGINLGSGSATAGSGDDGN